MCNRYKYTADIVRWFNERGVMVVEDEQWHLPSDVFPKTKGAILTRENDAAYRLRFMPWGILLPVPGKAPKPVTNVRNLSARFWQAYLREPERRCLVPFSQFCEPDWRSGSHIPAWFTTSDPIGCFAGIYGPGIDGIERYSFLTCEPNPLVAPIHEKAMPVVLQPEDYEEWLTGDHPNICRLATPYPSQLMSMA